MKIILLLIVFITTSILADAQAGKIDSTFGVEGISILNETPAYNIEVMSDNSIITFIRYADSELIYKYKPNGLLDFSFANKGSLNLNTKIFQHYYQGMFIQADDKIVLCGYHNFSYSLSTRYLPDGSVDSSYGIDGSVITPIFETQTSGSCDFRFGIQQPDGKLIFCGPGGLMARYLYNGKLDSTFGENGIVGFLPSVVGILHIALQANGRIILLGRGSVTSTDYSALRLFGFKPNGIIDSTFGKNGISNQQFYTYDYPYDILIQKDQKIVIAADGGHNHFYHPFLLRLTSNGKKDPSFGDNGFVRCDGLKKGNYYLKIYSLLQQKDGKLLSFGYFRSFLTAQFPSIVRFNTLGVVDTSYFINTDYKHQYKGEIYDAAFQSDGKIVLSGHLGEVGWFTRIFGESKLTNTLSTPINLQKIITLKLSPNPASKTVIISGLQAGVVNHISITDNYGKEIKAFTTTSSTFTQTIQNLTAGVYYVQVISNGKMQTLKLVKE